MIIKKVNKVNILDRGSSPGRRKNFLRPVLRPTQPPLQWVPLAVSPGVKRPRREADHTSNLFRGQEYADLYSHFPVRFQGVMLN
jgi:hypothetical protein